MGEGILTKIGNKNQISSINTFFLMKKLKDMGVFFSFFQILMVLYLHWFVVSFGFSYVCMCVCLLMFVKIIAFPHSVYF